MAKINYNGIELEEVTEPQIFDPPKTMVVWRDDDEEPITAEVIAIFAESCNFQYRVVINDCSFYTHCAFIPEKPSPRRATWMELAKWCANGNGLVLDELIQKMDTGVMFKVDDQNNPVDDRIKVRKWGDAEWHTPDVEYMSIMIEPKLTVSDGTVSTCI